MPLLSLWQSNPAAVTELSFEQIVATSGDGKLRDESTCSAELREYLSQVSSDRLAEYAENCLNNSFPKSGLALQDVVNELGRRLDYQVENGRYQGTPGGIGFDGLWRGPDGFDVVVEVKTTDAYRVPLNTIAAYRDKLRAAGRIGTDTSILLVVGREDTGELEAQVRGSRHAWDMRLISVDALARLVSVKQSTEAGVTGAKIRSVLVPMEYTRLDRLVDVMFATAKDVEATAESDNVAIADELNDQPLEQGWVFTDPEVLQRKRELILNALARRDGKRLVKRSRALYSDAAHAYRAVCTISKRYPKKHQVYWYSYQPNWDSFLAAGEEGVLVLGGVDLDCAFAIPSTVIREHLPSLNVSTKADGSFYWHLNLVEPTPGDFALPLPKTGKVLPLREFRVSL